MEHNRCTIEHDREVQKKTKAFSPKTISTKKVDFEVTNERKKLIWDFLFELSTQILIITRFADGARNVK